MLFCLMVTNKKTPLTRWKMHKSLHKVNITPVWYMKTSNVCSEFCHSGNVCFTPLLGGNLEPPEFLHLSLNYDVIQKQDFLNQHNLSIPINPANAYTWKQEIFFEHLNTSDISWLLLSLSNSLINHTPPPFTSLSLWPLLNFMRL